MCITPKFNESGICYLKDAAGNSVLLKETVWQKKTGKPERAFLAFNFDKIVAVVGSPDERRQSESNPNAFILYKRFKDIVLLEGVSVPFREGYIAVVIEKHTSGVLVVKTMYSTDRLKKG